MPESPGAATAGRARLDRQLTGEMDRSLRVFLREVNSAAQDSLPTAVLLAAGRNPFTLGSVLGLWETVVEGFGRTVGRFFGRGKGTDPFVEAYLRGMQQRLRSSNLPSRAYSSAVEVLTASTQQSWSRPKTTAELRLALAPDRGTSVRTQDPSDAAGAPTIEEGGFTYATTAERIARTEATAAYGVSSLVDLGRAGVKYKRWVSHHDRHVRPAHASASGQTVPLTGSFVVGGYTLPYPGDPSAPTGQTANCRCVIVGADKPSR